MTASPSPVAYAEDAAYAPRRRPERAAAGWRNPLHSGVVWIVIVGALLAGLVAVNVAVLQLNVQLDRLARERATLREENAALASSYSSASAAARIEARARMRFGAVPAAPEQMTYVELPAR